MVCPASIWCLQHYSTVKILHIETRFHPSYGYQVQQLVRLHSKAHEVAIVTSKSFGNLPKVDSVQVFSEVDRKFQLETGARIIRLNSLLEYRDKLVLKELAKTVEKERPDIIFVHGVEYMALMQLILSGTAKKFPLVTDSHDLPSAARNEFLRALFRWPLKLVTIRFLNKHRIRTYYVQPQSKEMLRRYGVREDIMHYLPLGVDDGVFYSDPGVRNAMRRNHEIKDDDIVILYTGKRDYDKDPALILEAAIQLSGDLLENVKIFMVGAEDPEYSTNRLNPLLGRSELAGRTLLMDAVPFEKLAGFYAMADIGVFPLRNTMSALDAMACGLPLIMQDDDTNRERLEHGGLVYKSGNSQELARKISQLMTNPIQRLDLSKGGQRYVAENYSYRMTVKKLEDDMLHEIRHHKLEYENVH